MDMIGLISIILVICSIAIGKISTYKLSISEFQKLNNNGQREEHVVIFAIPDSNETDQLADGTSNRHHHHSFTGIRKLNKAFHTGSELAYLFSEFKTVYNRKYRDETQERKRFKIFSYNLGIIRQLQENKDDTAKYGVTEFTDLTEEEFLRFHTGYVKNKQLVRKRLADVDVLNNLTENRDWRKSGAVTEVKNQGMCGSCWAFSVTGNIEGVWKLKKGSLVSLSEQQLVDCDKVDKGCSGGLMLDAYKEVERMGGLETEGDYPYKARGTKSCRFNSTEVKVYINDSVALPQNEQQIAKYVDENGPVAVAINASPLMFYMGGIAHPYRIFCNPHHLNHGVLIVGFGVEKQKPFWIIKNSWGAKWGEAGYFRLFRGQGVCGVDQDASSVIVK